MHNDNHLEMSAEQEGVSAARVVPDAASHRFAVLVANAKGGCGKTTLSTNLASYYASRGQPVTLLDMDPQQSSTLWLRQRLQQGHQHISGQTLPIDARFNAGKLQAVLRDSEQSLVIDSPAGLNGAALDAVLRVSQVVLVPVLPSPIDIRAATRFLQAVMLSPAYRRRPRRLAVIANRTRERTRMYGQLEAFLNSLKIPFLTTLRDTQLYVQATGMGIGVAEINDANARTDQEHWRRVVEWIEVQKHLTRAMPGWR